MKKIRPLKTTASTLITYTITFIIVMAGIFALFLLHGRSFVNSSDAYDQGYFWTAEMGNYLKSLFSGDGYPLWSWDRGTGLDTKLPIDPFMIIASLFPAGKIELGYTIAIVLRLWFAGIAFILFAREAGLGSRGAASGFLRPAGSASFAEDFSASNRTAGRAADSAAAASSCTCSGNFQAFIGAICYVTSSFTINVALVQGQFIDMFILFPLLVMAVDRIYKGKSPLLFMLVVGVTVGINYYLAFMAAIGIILYIIFRYFRYYDFEAKRYFAYIGRFIVYGITGIMIAAIFVYVTIKTLSGASTGERPEVSLLYSLSHYYKSALNLVSAGYTFGYKYIGIPILALLAVPVISCKAAASKFRPAASETISAVDHAASDVTGASKLSPADADTAAAFGHAVTDPGASDSAAGHSIENEHAASKPGSASNSGMTPEIRQSSAAAIARTALGSTHAIMVALMSLMALSPMVNSMFNAFSYETKRWYFMLVFFLVWCAAEHLDLDELARKKNVIVMLIWWGILTFTTLGFAYLDLSGDLKLRQAMFVGGSLAAGLVMIIFIAVSGKRVTPGEEIPVKANDKRGATGMPACTGLPDAAHSKSTGPKHERISDPDHYTGSRPESAGQYTAAAVGRPRLSLGIRQTVITVMLIGTLVIVWNCSFRGQIDKKFFRYGEINRQLEKSTQRAGSLIEDDGFYRIDQTDWINSHLKSEQPVNENLWWGNDTIYIYDSKLPSRLSEFNRLLGNNFGYSKRVYMQSNGNRMGLDFLYGVKYYLGDDNWNSRHGADAFAGYAFDFYKEIDGVNVFKSRYDSSLGFMYDKFMTESEFEKLSRLEREQAILQALVVPDDEVSLMDESMQITAADIETDIAYIPYQVVSTDGVTAEFSSAEAQSGDTDAASEEPASTDTAAAEKESESAAEPTESAADTDSGSVSEDAAADAAEDTAAVLHSTTAAQGGVFVADKEKATITIHVDNVKDSQLVLSFDGLRRYNDAGKEVGNFMLRCQSSKLKTEANNKKNNQTIAGIVDYDLNMGYYEEYSGNLTIEFSQPGRYEFDRLYVSAMSTANFDKYATERCRSVYEVTERSTTKVSGTLDADSDGYLFLSIPVNANWNVYIDGGQVAEIHNANIAFFATPVTAGSHTVELRYDHTSRHIALAITLAGLILAALLTAVHRKRSRSEQHHSSGNAAR